MLSNLNEKQKEAVELGLGPAMILAGPGSGKTTVLLHRIQYLVDELHISPNNILVITFTKAAAIELSKRAEQILHFSNESPFFGTFHSFFYSVLKQSYEYQNFSIMTLKQKSNNLEQLLKIRYPKLPISKRLILEILSCISKRKNRVFVQKEIESLGFTQEKFEQLQKEYTHFNYENKFMDYDDIMLLAYELLTKNEGFLSYLQGKISYILIDEFQDVNSIQYDLISLLAGENGNLFVVGDDDQSIYKFRGAGEQNFRKFEQDFKRAKQVLLDINYRCPKEIVEVSSKLITYNQKRYEKELYSGKIESGTIHCRHFFSKEEERNYILELIKEQLAKTEPKELAVLCRTNNQLSYFAERLKKEKIDFYMKEKQVCFYEKETVKSLIGYCMFATGVDKSRRRLFSFLNSPVRFIKRDIFADCSENQVSLVNLQITDEMQRKQLLQLDEQLQRIAKMNPKVAINYILKVVGFEKHILEKCTTKEELTEWKETIEDLKTRASIYSSLKEWMEFVKLEEDMEDDNLWVIKNKDALIKLYTFHGSKGLEFHKVIIPHLNEGSVPYKKELSQDALEEERRMFYVALTRSSSDLMITFVQNDTKKDTVSRFLKECALTVSK